MELSKIGDARSAIRVGLTACQVVPNAPKPDPVALEIWAKLLAEENISDPAEIEAAFTRHLQTVKWFPAPAEIITLVKAIRREKAEARKREIDRRDALPASKKSPEQIEADKAERAKIRAAMPFGARKFMDLPKQVIPSESEDVIITKEDLDRRDAMIAQLRAGR